MEKKSSTISNEINKINTKLEKNYAVLCKFKEEELSAKFTISPDNSCINECREVKDVLEYSAPQMQCKKLAYQRIHIRNK